MSLKIDEIVTALATYYDKKLSPAQLGMYVADLSCLSPEHLREAVRKYRLDPANAFFPLPAKLIALAVAADGRPGVEEAWSIAPKSDGDAAYINEEIMKAWSAAEALLSSGGDMVSARMTFKEVYERTVRENRSNGIAPKWWLTRAYGPGSERVNEAALRDAVEKGRLPEPKAVELLPTYVTKQTIALEHNGNADAVRKIISNTFNKPEEA